jgi:NADH:ubiquinone oxidoreductase subunit 2 (subunit N)
MRLLVLLAIGLTGAVVSAWGLPRGGRVARITALVGVAALAGVTGAAFLLRTGRLTDTGQPITGPFDAHLVVTDFLRMVVGLWGLESLVLVALAVLLGGLPRLRGLLPATLAALTGGTVAMTSADLAVGAAAAAATGLAGLIVILAAQGPSAVAAGARELRVTLAAGAVLLVAMAVVPLAARLALIASGVGLDQATEDASTVAGPALGLVILTVAAAVAARWGMLPFHVRVSRLTDLVPPEALPLLIAWSAVPLTVVAFAMVDRFIAPLALPLDGERALILLAAIATLAGASLAAYFQDDLRHAVGYLVIADAGLLLLAIAALDPAALDPSAWGPGRAWGAGRAWVVVLAASKTALGAWAAVAEDRFETRSLPELRGWMRQSPLLSAALVITAVATFGLPGWVALQARVDLAAGVWGSPWSELLLVAGFLTLPTYLRFARLGLGRATSRVDRAAPERIVRRRKPLESLRVEQEGSEGTTLVGGEPGAGPRHVATSVIRSAAVESLAGVGRARALSRGAVATARGVLARTSPASRATQGDEPSAGDPAVDESPVAPTSERARPVVRSGAGARIGAAGARAGAAGAWVGAGGARFAGMLRRDRTELLSGAVLALAILAALTSWGALDLARAAAEPAPIIVTGTTD